MEQLNFAKTMELVKAKKTWATVGVAVALVSSYSVGSSSAQADIDGAKLNYEQIVKKIQSVNTELKKKQDELKAEDQRLNQRKAEVDQALALADKKDQISKELDTITKELDNKKNELNTLNTDIQTKQTELEKITNIVQTKKEEPRTLPAGEYIVGKDIDPGRYKAVPVGRGSNFFVYGTDGFAKVNTILGSGDFGEKEYVFFTDAGDVIRTEAKARLIPVE